MPGTLLIVESPSKAKSIQGYLGAGFTVRASFGHITDLPMKDLGVDLTTLEETYVPRESKNGLRNPIPDLKKLAKGFDRVLVASDPDREGEAIAWHLARELGLKLKEPIRVEFREVTPDAVRRAVQSPRLVDMHRVDAQRGRRVVDRIVGFLVSEKICWPAGAQSAGRVQTPALHILCVREREIVGFVAKKYWTLGATYAEGFKAFVPAGPKDTTIDGADAGDGEDADAGGAERKGRLVPKQYASQAEADLAVAEARKHPHIVRDVQQKRTEVKPEPPYTTSTLQQDGNRVLRLSVKQVADLAQQLFEAGYITYHRTDSTRIADVAVAMAREYIGAQHPEVLPAQPPTQRTKAGAQDGHEAIRPTHLTGDDAPPPGTQALYALIKARFLASQSKPAVYNKSTVWLDSGPLAWVAQGSVLLEPGYLVYWGQYAKQSDTLLPALSGKQRVTPTEIAAEAKQTAPPPRYTEATLVKKLEASGVGRPSTYPSIIDTLFRRQYVQKFAGGRGKEFLQPTDLGLKLDALLEQTFPDLVSEEYTAEMEGALDKIEHDQALTRSGYLRGWYADFDQLLTAALPRAKAYCEANGLRARAGGGAQGEETTKKCDRCGEANYRKIQRKTGRGSFLACPACNMTRDIQAKVKPAGCPQCGSALIERSSQADKKRTFFGCVRYGAQERPCSYIERADGSAGGAWTRTVTDKPCPKCAKQKLVTLVPSDPAKGRGFYACEDKNHCKFTLQIGFKRRKDPCPECGGVLLQRQAKQSDADKAAGKPPKYFWGCARFPDCTVTLEWEPASGG